MKTFEKDPDAKKDYSVDWTSWLNGDTIAVSTWLVPDGLTVASPSPSQSAAVATIWLSGGTLGERYEVTNRITTEVGRIEDHTFAVLITQK